MGVIPGVSKKYSGSIEKLTEVFPVLVRAAIMKYEARL